LAAYGDAYVSPDDGTAYGGPGDAAYGGTESGGPAYVEPGDGGPAVYRDPSAPEPPPSYDEPTEPSGDRAPDESPSYAPADEAVPAAVREPEDPGVCFSAPNEPAAYGEEPAGYREEPAGYREEPAGYDEEASGYSEKASGYSEKASAYGEEPAESGDATEPEPYLAPHDPNTGAQTVPFRGPFEPHPAQPKLSDLTGTGLLPAEMTSSAVDPVGVELAGSELARSELAGSELAGSDLGAPDLAGSKLGEPELGSGPDQKSASERSREKLEKIKDLYLTVEAIGDDNVGKHFDELMQRQRELISDYFKETGIGSGKSRAHQPDPRRQNLQPRPTRRRPARPHPRVRARPVRAPPARGRGGDLR